MLKRAPQDSELLVWDIDDPLQGKHEQLVYWQSYNASETGGIYSAPKLVENNADQLRSQYLALIYELGEAKVNGKRVVEHLELQPGFSYWWMTLLTEKCNFAKSPQIDNVIKLMAFKAWLKGKGYKHILLVSANSKLAAAMHHLANDLVLGFEWQESKQQRIEKSLVMRIYNRLPYSLQAFVWLSKHLISRWSLRGVGVDEWKKTKAKTTFISYLFNLVPDAAKDGHYESRYWTALPQVLEEHQVNSNWLHLYVKDAFLTNSKEAAKVIKQFNKANGGNQVHVTLDSFLNSRLIFLVLWDWFQLFRLKKSLSIALQKKSGIYWPFLQEDYLNSMVGTAAMSNLLYLRLFQCAMSSLPSQKRGVYLQENQGWEFGFIHSWRESGHSNFLVGIPHTTIKFWDLRYFFDQRSYRQLDRCSLPVPDYVGINGEMAKKMVLEGGYPNEDLIEVEALRYLHLNQTAKHKAYLNVSGVGEMTLLVLGDYLKENTIQQMELLRIAAQRIDKIIKYIIKPHPACPILVEDYPELDLTITNDPIPTLIDHCSLVYTSSTTSAAVDAYCAGKPVVTVLDPKRLNLSPLKGSEGVSFVSSPDALAAVLNRMGQMKEVTGQGKDYFYLDPNLSRWKRLLKQGGNSELKLN